MVSSLVTSVSGTLEAMGLDWIDVRLGGISVRIHIPTSVSDRLGDIGHEVRLLTSLQVREDSLTLYGFLTEDERLSFELLLGVNGVGPKVALNVMSKLSPESLISAVESGNNSAFGQVSGVGKKTASRIVLELRGKLRQDWSVSVEHSKDQEAIRALVALGYSELEAGRVLSSIKPNESMTVEDKVRLALQSIND